MQQNDRQDDEKQLKTHDVRGECFAPHLAEERVAQSNASDRVREIKKIIGKGQVKAGM